MPQWRAKTGLTAAVIAGGAVYINSGASPTIKNCVIRDTTITGGNAGNGSNADATVACQLAADGAAGREAAAFISQILPTRP